MKRILGLFTGLAMAAALAVASTGSAWAAYPDRPIRMLVVFPAGGTADVLARLVAEKLGKKLKTSIVIENIPGAGGVLATKQVADAEPDGYTMLFTTNNHTISPALHKSLPFDTEADLAPISLLSTVPMLLIENVSSPFSDFKGFVEYAKANPGKLTYASAGIGTLPHVGMELLLNSLGLKVVHVPYKGASPAMTDLLAGQVNLKLDTIQTSTTYIETGKIRALGIGSLERDPLLPDVPTFAEQNLPNFQVVLWQGILAPAKTPNDVVDTLSRAIGEVYKDPDLLARFKKDGVHPVASSPEEFAATIKAEIVQWKKVVQDAGITAE